MSPTSHYIACAGRELHYTEWGDGLGPQAETVIAWHGLARTCRDMDDIAAHLARALPGDLPGHDRAAG